MRSEFQFFMTHDDEADFVSMAATLADSIDQTSDIQWFLKVGDCPIQLLRSSSSDAELIAGRISISTTGFGADYESAQEAKRAYKRMRNWLKKSYTNRMTCRNTHIDGSQMPLKTFWASPRVVEIAKADGAPVLKQIPGAPVVFELEDFAEQDAAADAAERRG